MLNLDDAFEFYNQTKRTKTPGLKYDKTREGFFVEGERKKKWLKDFSEDDEIVDFFDSYEECVKIMNAYLETPEKNQFAEKCKAEMSGKKDKFTPFIWFFDHIDGGYNFEYYERVKIKKVIVKWCKRNDIEYVDPSSPDDFKWVIERFGPIPK